MSDLKLPRLVPALMLPRDLVLELEVLIELVLDEPGNMGVSKTSGALIKTSTIGPLITKTPTKPPPSIYRSSNILAADRTGGRQELPAKTIFFVRLL